jgi:four helix bundle protein
MNVELDKRNAFKLGFRKRCFDFSLAILRLAEICREKRANWILIDQLVRSATSIGANIVEGGNSTSKKEFINYFQISLKSASETIYWLELLREINVDKKEQIDYLIDECAQIKKIISTIILNTKDNSRL